MPIPGYLPLRQLRPTLESEDIDLPSDQAIRKLVPDKVRAMRAGKTLYLNVEDVRRFYTPVPVVR